MDFQTMYQEVMDYVPDSKMTIAEAKKFVNRAYIQMAMSFQFYGLETSGTFNTAAGDFDYAIATVAAGAKDIIGIYNETDDCPLQEETIQWWEEIEVDPTTLQEAPRYWVRFGDELLLWPTPDTAYTLRIRYKTNPTELSSNGDEPVFPEEWHECIVLWAASKAAFSKGYTNIGVNIKNEYLSLVGALQEEQTMQARRRVGQIGVQRFGPHHRRRRSNHAEFD